MNRSQLEQIAILTHFIHLIPGSTHLPARINLQRILGWGGHGRKGVFHSLFMRCYNPEILCFNNASSLFEIHF